MKVLLDTNILLDVALEREPFFEDSDRLLAMTEQGQISGYICTSGISDLFYFSVKVNDPRFVFYLFENFDLSRFASGSGVFTLNRNHVHNEKVTRTPP